MTFHRFPTPSSLLRLASLAFLFLTGCRLSEPEHYVRRQFPPGTTPTRVLFVGNSMTYYNDLPGLVQQLSVHEEKPIQVASVTQAYSSLEHHWKTRKPQTLLAEHPWDFVVLQEFSRRPVTNPINTEKYFNLFAAAARQAGAKPIIFQNWTRTGHADEYAAMLSTYLFVKDQTAATIAPIGLAWKLCALQHPEIKLFLDDRHPTDDGTYLTACVLYGTIYSKDPTTLPLNLQGPKLSAERIQTLREIAATALRQGPK